MSTPVQLAPLLSLYMDDGDYTLRVDDSPLGKKIGPEIIRLLSGSGGRRLTILTPTDTKIFKLNGATHAQPTPKEETRVPEGSTSLLQEEEAPADNQEAPTRTPLPTARARHRFVRDNSAPPPPEIAEEEVEEVQRVRAEEREAERLRKEMEAANRADPNLPSSSTDAEEEVALPRVRKRAQRPEPSQVATTPCGRCYGAGQLDGGVACPVCQGRGSHQLYGRRR